MLLNNHISRQLMIWKQFPQSFLKPTINNIRGISRVSVEGKSSVCVICMKYRIIVLIIIIISLGQIILSYIYMANTSRTHTHTRTHSRIDPPTHRRHHPGCRCYMGGVRPTMTNISPLFACSAGHAWPVGASLK